MDVNELVLVQGMDDTKRALRRWNEHPWRMLRPWATLSLLIALALLGAVYVVAKLSTPDPTTFLIPGYNSKATFQDYLAVLYRNSLVLALHAMACVAGFMAGSSLPLSASKRTGLSRRRRSRSPAGPPSRAPSATGRCAWRPTAAASCPP